MNENRTYLRPEALPLVWEDLDRSQQQAFQRLVGMLADALPMPELGGAVAEVMKVAAAEEVMKVAEAAVI